MKPLIFKLLITAIVTIFILLIISIDTYSQTDWDLDRPSKETSREDLKSNLKDNLKTNRPSYTDKNGKLSGQPGQSSFPILAPSVRSADEGPQISPPPTDSNTMRIEESDEHFKDKKMIAEMGGRIYIGSLILEGVKSFERSEIERLYAGDLKRTYTFTELKEMLKKITNYYHEQGYMLAQAIVPNQKIKNNAVRVVILEGILQKLIIKNDTDDPAPEGVFEWIQDQMYFFLKEETALNKKHIENFIALANRIPGVLVKAILSRSEVRAGGTVLTFVVKFGNRFAGSYQLNNYGSSSVGPLLVQATGEVRNLGIIGETGIRVLKTPFENELFYGQFYWQQFLTKRGLKLLASIDNSSTRLGGNVKKLNLKGHSASYLLGVSMPWKASLEKFFSIYLKASEFRGNLLFDSRFNLYNDRIEALRLGNTFNFFSEYENNDTINTSINMEVSKGFKFFKYDERSPSRVNGHRDFNKINADLLVERVHWFENPYWYATWVAGISSQWGFNSLLSVEELSFGGQEYGRGYNSGSISGDSGVLGKVEFHLNRRIDLVAIRNLDFFAFTDAARLYTMGKKSTLMDENKGLSVGGGICTSWAFNLYSKFTVAKPLLQKGKDIVAKGREFNKLSLFFAVGGSF